MVTSIVTGQLYYFPTYQGGAVCAGTRAGNVDDGRVCLVVIWRSKHAEDRYTGVGASWVLDNQMAAEGSVIELDMESFVAELAAAAR